MSDKKEAESPKCAPSPPESDKPWRCSECSLDNNYVMNYCEMCFNRKPSTADLNAVSWSCKLCSMSNNQHMPYCETCLVSKDIQENEQIFHDLQTELKSNDCDDHIKADEIKDMVEKLKNDIERLKNYQTDTDIVGEIQHQIDEVYAKNGIPSQPDIVKEFMEAFGGNHDAFKQQRKYNQKCHPVCKCGTMMDSVKANKCYNTHEYSCVICDICNERVPLKRSTFHCPRQKVVNIHPHGFDICLKCRKQHIHRLRYFVAIIICPNMTKRHENNDAEALRAMFQKLGFHKIVCLKGALITKQTIESTLRRLLPSDPSQNVNQFTCICYSGHGFYDEKDRRYFLAIEDQKPSTWIPFDFMPLICKATKYGAVADGLLKGIKSVWHQTSYRHNTLLLVNSCHSGASNRFVSAQKIADTFGECTAWSTLLSVFGVSCAAVRAGVRRLSVMMEKQCMECIQGVLRGEITVECLAECFGVSSAAFVAIAKIAGVAIIVVIIIAVTIYCAIRKSKQCESVFVIASCRKKQTSNTGYGVSPFFRHCIDFFDFCRVKAEKKANGTENADMQNIQDSPQMLLNYLAVRYNANDESLGGLSLNDLSQTVCSSQRGFVDFAMCPMLNSINQ